MAKSDQMLSILWFLRTRGRITAEQLAETLEISVRTVYRHIDSLCASGVPIVSESGHGGGFSLPKSFQDAPLFFNNVELTAMIHAASFAEQAGYPHVDSLQNALKKMKHRMNAEQMDEVERRVSGFEVIPYSTDNFTLMSLLQELEQAVTAGEAICMKYEKWKGNTPVERDAEPYGLVYRGSKWYLIAFCRLRQEVRVFRVDRISSLSHTGMFFQKPDNFSARDYFSHMIKGDVPEAGDSISVKIRGEKGAIDQLCEHWHLRHSLIERDAEQALFLLDYQNTIRYMPSLLLYYGKRIHVVEPLVLREKLAEVAQDLASYYVSIKNP